MGLCRFLPIPSDRMGVLWSLLNITDAIVLEYGPAGTTHFSAGFFRKIGTTQENRYFTTHMSEDDVVMGDVKRLEKAIIELDEDFSPKVIFVVASSISAVIGTDLIGVCTYMQEKVSARLVTFENAGLRGDYSAGLVDTYSLIVKELVFESEGIIDNSYNIIGASYESYRAMSDVNEIKSLMKTAFDYDMNVSLCTPNTLENIEKMSSAKLNLVISYEGLKSAQYLNKKYGTPFIYGAPYGYKGTLEWLKSVSEEISKDIAQDVLDEINVKSVDMIMYARYKAMLTKIVPKAYIYADYDRVVGLSNLLSEFSIDTPHKICKHSLKFVKNIDGGVKNITSEKERMQILKQNKMLVLADDVSIMITDESNTTVRVSTPFLRGSQVATHLPFMGIKGADYMREYIDQYLGVLVR